MEHAPIPPSLIAPVVAGLLVVAAPTQNLLPSPGFEAGVVSCSAQGGLPAPWGQAGLVTIGADTYSVDCATRSGLDASWTNFNNGFAAHCGLRWVAGGNNTSPVEAIGAALNAPLQPNTTYLFAGWFRRNDRPNVQGNTGYDVGFGPQADVAAATVAVPQLAAGSAAFAWREHSTVFTTGANTASSTHVVLAPVPGPGDTSYMGIDDVVLAEVGGFYSYPEGAVTGHQLDGAGAVTAGTTLQLTASSALPGLPCVLAAGTESGCAPLLGQTLAVLPIVTTWQLTDSSGGATFPFTWPSGLPVGLRCFFQTWILDANGGVSASNGLAAVGG